MVVPGYIYRALLYREVKILRLSILKSMFILLVPIITTLAFCVARGSHPDWTIHNMTDSILEPVALNESAFYAFGSLGFSVKIVYYPKDNTLDSLRRCINNHLDGGVQGYIPVNSTRDVIQEFIKQVYYGKKEEMELVSIGFDDISVLHNYLYSAVKWNQTKIERNIFMEIPLNPGPIHTTFVYYTEDVIMFIINKCLFVELSEGDYTFETVPFQIQCKLFPYPVYAHDENREIVISSYIPFLILGLSVMLLLYLMELKYDFDSGVEEMLNIMGISKYLQLGTRFFRMLFPHLIVSLFLPLIIKHNFSKVALIEYAGYWVLYLLFVLYFIAVINFMFALLALIRNKFVTGAVFIAVIAFMPALHPTREEIIKHISCIFPNVILHYAFHTLNAYDIRERYLDFSEVTANDKPLHMDYFNMLDIYTFLVLNAFFYFCVHCYITNVYPHRFSRNRRWYFPFLNLVTERFFLKIDINHKLKIKADIEKAAFGATEAIRLFNVCHHAGSFCGLRRYVIKNLSMTFYTNKITVIIASEECLQTLFNLFCGMWIPHEGILTAHGTYVKDDITRVRNLVGFCPTKGMFMPGLTLQETLIFIALVKGKTHKVAEDSATQLLNLYELKDKCNEYYESLGNMDRKKFSIALSRAGDPKVILYFKPTAGFSEGTQDIWNQILLEASSRTIILATDNFEEAEYLADRIAIFDKGYLRCYGTPMFIKSSYKTGYLLRIQKEADYQESIISQLINRYLPNSSLQVFIFYV